MVWIAWPLLGLAWLGTASSTVYLALVLLAARRHRRKAAALSAAARLVPARPLPPVSILKPVHGNEPRLAENLESFFLQDYPDFEIIVSARDAENPALQIAQQVRAKYPHVKSRIMLSGSPTWPSAKVFSLDRMIAEAASQCLVISDSDILVRPDFLRNVVPPLLDPETGLVTCLYQGIPAGDFWSLLEALGMSVEMPSGVMVADMLEGMRFALGAAMVVRRDALDAIGGIASTADFYSDDFVLGNRIWAAGYKVVLSHYVVGHVLVPRTFRQTFADQLRWMKSTRHSRPKGHVGAGLTYATPYGILGCAAASALGHPLLGIALLAAALLNRTLQSAAVGWRILGDPRALKLCWLYPLRDLLGFCTWAASFGTRNFSWRGEAYSFGAGGRITPQHRESDRLPERS